MQNVLTAFYLIVKALELLVLLPACMLSRRVFDKVWKKYYVQPLPKDIFNLCVQWLMYHGEKTHLSYTQINVLIFCIIWPVVTVFSIVLNILLLIKLG